VSVGITKGAILGWIVLQLDLLKSVLKVLPKLKPN